MSRIPLPDRLIARVIHATVLVDRAYKLFDRARSALVARLAPDGALARLNDLAYNARTIYSSESSSFKATLFNWEEEALAGRLPAPPARILVGGAGGGREAFALCARGYDVVAFEPSASLAEGLSRPRPDGRVVAGYRARYEDLPWLAGVPGGPAGTRIDALPRFQAAVLGWASYSHIRTAGQRAAALRALADVTDGPILISFYPAPAGTGRPPAGIRRWLDRIGLWSPTDRFTPFVGFYHLATREEIAAEAEGAGLRLLHLSEDDSDGRWPYAILARRDLQSLR